MFLPTPHGVLAGLFGRAPQPVVVPVLRYRNTTPLQTGIRIAVEVHIRNDGRGFAEDVFAVVNMDASKKCDFSFPIADYLHERWRTDKELRSTYTTRLRGLSLPPGTERLGFEIGIGIPSADVGGISVEVTCGSRGGPAAVALIEVSAAIVANVHCQYTAVDVDLPTIRSIQARADDQIRSCIRQ